MCGLKPTKETHNSKQVSVTINNGVLRPSCRFNNFHQTGPQRWRSFVTNQGRGRMENGFSHTRYGHYEYQVMPFALLNAPATLQAMMNTILIKFLDHGVVVYLDKILIDSKNEEEHVELIKKVLAQLENYDLAVSTTKSVFHIKEVEFLGFIVAVDGVTMSERKVQSIKDWKHPRSVKEVQIFIGFANFYRQFVKDFSKICKPITKTFKGDRRMFNWGPDQNNAFEVIKKRFSPAPILCHFVPDRETIVKTDASDFALGCVFSQFKDKQLHRVVFHSRKLSEAERNYKIHDTELLAILEAFIELPHYLVGTKDPITVYTHHQNLQTFLTTKVWNQREIRWVQQLANYNFKIVYRPGKRGGKPDELSRPPEYNPEEGATHCEQLILKPDHFQISLVQVAYKDKDKAYESNTAQEDNSLRIKLLSSRAKMPTRRSRIAAGHDLYTMENIHIPARGQVLVETGLAIGLQKGTYARIAPRSGLVSKKRISVGGGIIDADYTGEVKVMLISRGNEECLIQVEERMAQIMVEEINTKTAVQ